MSAIPADPTSFHHRFVLLPNSGRRYHLVDQPPTNHRGPLSDAPTLLLLHGFPDLWFGWRYQIAAFAARGWRVLCPDQLGYGQTDKPSDIEAYTFRSVAYDMNLLLDEVQVSGQVVVVGHDWGGMVAWRFANYFPDRVKALVSVCTPYSPPAQRSHSPLSDEELLAKVPSFGYQLYFKQNSASGDLDEVAEAFLQPMHSATFRRTNPVDKGLWVRKGEMEKRAKKLIQAKHRGALASVVDDPEFQVYLDAYKGGFAGPLSWYKTRAANFRDEQRADLPAMFPGHIPVLQIPAALDAALPPSMSSHASVLRCFRPGMLDVRVVENGDHWLLHDEKTRDGVTTMMADWIEDVLAGRWTPAAPRL